MDKLKAPPIQYLKTFVIAAKHMSFKQAALELHLTPSAISQQIKNLESHLALSLFNRNKKPLSLTKAGSCFLNLSQTIIQDYESGFKVFMAEQKSAPFRLSCTTYLANQCLIPHLAGFNKANPQTKLALHTSETVLSLETNELDAAIRFTANTDAHARLISPTYLVLMCSKDYLNTMSLTDTIDWRTQSLIHCRQNYDDWYLYLSGISALSKDEYQSIEHHYFDSYEAGIQAAKAGLGITFAVHPLSKYELEKQTLVALPDIKIKLAESLYLITQNDSAKEAEYEAILNWVKGLLN